MQQCVQYWSSSQISCFFKRFSDRKEQVGQILLGVIKAKVAVLSTRLTVAMLMGQCKLFVSVYLQNCNRIAPTEISNICYLLRLLCAFPILNIFSFINIELGMSAQFSKNKKGSLGKVILIHSKEAIHVRTACILSTLMVSLLAALSQHGITY